MRFRPMLIVAAVSCAAVLPAPGRDDNPFVTVTRQALEKAVEKGDTEAMVELGERALSARDGLQDLPAAVAWFRQAAEKGNAFAMAYLGDMHRDGIGVNKDHQQALDWYRKSLDGGCARANAGMGSMYANGYGVAQDDREAVRWFSDHLSGKRGPGQKDGQTNDVGGHYA